MDYKKFEIEAYFEEWIMQRVHDSDELIKGYKALDEENEMDEPTYNYIMEEFQDWVQPVFKDDEEAAEWVGSASNLFAMYRFIMEYDDEIIFTDPHKIVWWYVNILSNDIVQEWMRNPKHTYAN